LRRRAVSGITLTLLVFSMSFAALQIQPVNAEPAMVSVDHYGSSNIVDTRLIPGTQFSINLTVDHVEELWAYQFTLSFSAGVLHGVNVEHGPFLESRGGKAVVVPGPGFDNDAGTLGLFAAYLFPIVKFPTGGGTLATVTFKVVGYGSSPITLGIETGLANRTGGWIASKRDNPELFVDGFFDNWPPCPPPYDIIYPQPGQFANYSLLAYFTNGTVFLSGWWLNLTYCEYVQPHIINTTNVVAVTPPGEPKAGWCTVNTTSRWVTDSYPEYRMGRSWYIPWIETPVTVGSTINWQKTTSRIVGNQILYAVGHHLDCWIANTIDSYYDYELSYYDKLSGLLVAHKAILGKRITELTLDATNIPLGIASLPFRLTRTVEGWSLPKGTEKSLTSKLEAAYHLLNKDNRNAALQHLTAFVKKVEVLSEKRLTTEQADHLIAEARRIINLIKE
jgi:hypothetical protein